MATSARADLHLGIDLGGSKILAAVFNAQGKVLAQAKRRAKAHLGYQAVVARLAQTATEALDAIGCAAQASTLRVGLAVPGPVDAQRGVVLRAGNLGWNQVPVARDLGKALGGASISVGNDVNCAAIAEGSIGAARGAGSAFLAYVGTGLGGALLIGGKPVHGHHGLAGEIGHLHSPWKARNGSGEKRMLSLEEVCSKTAIANRLLRALEDGDECALSKSDIEDLRSSRLAEAWKEGCPTVRKACRRAGRALGWGLTAVQAVADVDRLVLGGGVVTALGKAFLADVHEGMRANPFFTTHAKAELCLSALGDLSVAQGAALLPRLAGAAAQGVAA